MNIQSHFPCISHSPVDTTIKLPPATFAGSAAEGDKKVSNMTTLGNRGEVYGKISSTINNLCDFFQENM